MTAVTALTAQDTTGVHGIHGVPVDFIGQQMRVVLYDIGADAIKTGMLHSSEVIDAVIGVKDALARDLPLIVDPVMVAKGGASLLQEEAAVALRERLVPRATVLTPNVPEAEALTGLRIESTDDMRGVARALLELGPRAVLLKGGHLEGDEVRDLLLSEGHEEVFTSRRIESRHTHGTGCTLASAIATGLAQGMALRDAVVRARAYVLRAIETAPGFGHGHGPLNHAHTARPFMRGGDE
jgi:hydroxymethylpyrimidine/phosphomethylpyrimidine kinase